MNAFDAANWKRCIPIIESALQYSGGTHNIDDIERAITTKTMQFWPGAQSAVITEIQVYPRLKALHYFLAGGNLEELARMRPIIEHWAESIGCQRVTLAGRRGWIRSFLADEGYQEKWAVMSKELKK
jgi:hypothetical protein